MMTADVQSVIAEIHAAPQRMVLEFAGAGSMALWWLHSVAGSSRTILEATDRYAAASLADLLGGSPETAVSETTAVAMARRAYQRALFLSADERAALLGVACTAAIATDRLKRGEHRCVVAVCSATGMATAELVLSKGQRDRSGEEMLVCRLLIRSIARACGVDVPLALDLTAPEQLVEQWLADPIQQLLDGDVRTVMVLPDGRQEIDQSFSGALLSGSFNPLHAGHVKLLEAAQAVLGVPAAFELPVRNADKGMLTVPEVVHRLSQFRGHHTVVLTGAPLFREKAMLFPGCTFVVGYDTAERLVAPRYYGGVAGMHAALAAIRDQGCCFIVAGRVQQGSFHTLADLPVPPDFGDMFLVLPQEVFRVDLSSTELREQSGTWEGWKGGRVEG